MDKSLLNDNEYSWCFACGKDNPSNYLFAKEGKPSYTAKIEIRYRQPLAIGEEVVCTGRELKRKGRMVEMQGTICKKDGTLLAECLSKMMIVDETPQPSRKLAAGEGEEE